MKKRLCLILTLVIITVFTATVFSACGGEAHNGEYNLQSGKKYIREDDAKDLAYEQNYLLFNADGTGEYRNYYIFDGDLYSKYNEDYTIKFKYTYVDADKSAVVCFYDSIEFGEYHNDERDTYSGWSRLYTVSKNVICTASSSMVFYINDNYRKENHIYLEK